MRHAKVSDHEATGGPVIGPTGPPPEPLNGATSRSQSPYSSTRALLQDLTLPTYPNLNIPPSPQGSPLPGANEKFAHFLELKKQGVHFNDKLAKSSALKNPSLLHKLMGFVAIAEQDQYASTLPKDLWDPTVFPPWAYKEELAKAQQQSFKRREEERARKQREALEFVPESSSATSSRGATPPTSAVRSTWRGSAAERVMAGLNRDKVRSPHDSDTTPLKRRALDRGGGRNHS